MLNSNSMRPRRVRSGSLLVLIAFCFALSGCSVETSEITADTTCSDYLKHPGNERSDAAIRLSAEVPGVSSPGNPMWALSLDAACGSAPSKTIGEIFSHQ